MMSTLEDEIRGGLKEFLQQAGPFDRPIPAVTITPDQQAELAAAGVTITPGIPLVVHISRPKYVVPIPEGVACITHEQAAALSALVRAIVETHKAPFQTVWSSLNMRMGVVSYRLTPAASFDRAAAFLAHWRDTGLPPL